MRLLQATTEADMVALFLKTEITSHRFGEHIKAQLKRDHKAINIVTTPNIANAQENAYRRKLLVTYRAHVLNELPTHIRWHRALLARDEVAQVRYINYDYWNELSAGTRLPSMAAQTIRSGHEVFGQSNKQFLEAAQALRAGLRFPEIIVVGASPDATLTIYEGHLRLTAYLLAPECIPAETLVVVGFAPECAHI
jgi:hypothetical protein